jgi:hypothetical protein
MPESRLPIAVSESWMRAALQLMRANHITFLRVPQIYSIIADLGDKQKKIGYD